ncbi:MULTISPECIES: TIGR00366 family protein [Brevibacterium]|uniref:TIGR00366 family protein n=1 Tax=Brevibacterium salitolerans TaxID=1403566 RepID=A0ABN2WLX3_9MICO|nr:TIGR00366 family protein [Brevibacterium sp.]
MSQETGAAQKQRFMDRYLAWFLRWMPDSFVICLALTLIVGLLAFFLTGTPVWSPDQETTSLVSAWTGSFWDLLAFTMQMTVLLATGNAVATSPPAKLLLSRIASLPRTRAQMIVLGSVVAAALGFIHWGLGMMGGIVMGKELLAQAKRKGIRMHAPILVATLFMALLPGSAGMSGAAVLYAATPDYLRDLVPDTHTEATPVSVPLTDSVLRLDYGLLLVVCLFIGIVFMLLMHPKDPAKMKQVDPAVLESAESDTAVERTTPAQKANASRWIMYVIGGVGLVYSVLHIASVGAAGLDLNSYNFLFLALGMVLCANWGPEYYAGLVREGIAGTWGFILQFPFYAGIFGLISATGLGVVISHAFTAISTATTWPVIAFLYSGLLNIAVPSGGSKFVIEAPYIIPTTLDLDADLGLIMQAYQMGDGVTNLIIPFFALPYLANYKLKFSEVVGYTVPPVLLMLAVVCLYLFGMAALL